MGIILKYDEIMFFVVANIIMIIKATDDHENIKNKGRRK